MLCGREGERVYRREIPSQCGRVDSPGFYLFSLSCSLNLSYLNISNQISCGCFVSENPPSLQHLSRITIRRLLGPQQLLNPDNIENLPLTQVTKDYLLYKDLIM